MAGITIRLLPMAAFVGAAAAVLNGAVSLSPLGFNGDALVDNLKQKWAVYLGLPVAVAIAGSIAKGVGGNPGISLGKFRAKLW